MNNSEHHSVHSEDIHDIISTPPAWLLRWGITLVLAVILGLVLGATFIRYPEIVQAPLRINADNAPKPVINRSSGHIVRLLASENSEVTSGQALAWMESTADHQQVLDLLKQLHEWRDRQFSHSGLGTMDVHAPSNLRFGELQGSYQAFYQSYLSYLAATDGGVLLKRRNYILRDIQTVEAQRGQLELQQRLQQKEYKLAEAEFNRYQILHEQKVISPAEFQQQQALLLSRQHPLQQTQSSLLANEASHTAKTKELIELDNQIEEEKSKFRQALNSLVSQTEQWAVEHVLRAPQAGMLVYAGIIQENQYVEAGRQVFLVSPGGSTFFGEVTVPQYNMGKVRQGQDVLIKLNSYPFEEYGVVRGMVAQVNPVPIQDSIFLSKVAISSASLHDQMQLIPGMLGTAEIITEDASLLQRWLRNVRALVDQHR